MKQSSSDSRPAQILSWIIAAVLVLLPFHALLTTWAGSNFGYLDVWRIWKEVLLVAALPLAIVLVWRSTELKRWLIKSWIVRFLGLYILIHFILGAWALAADKVNDVAFIYSTIINLRFVSFFILCAVTAATSTFLLRQWPKILLGPAAAVLFFGLLQKFLLPIDFLRHFGYGPDTIPAYQTVDAKLDYRRLQSTLRGANPLGAYLILIMTAAVVILRKNRIILAIALTASAVVLFYSYSRSAWVGLILSLITLAFLSKRKISGRWLVAAGIAIVVMAGGFYLLRFNNTFQDTIFHTNEESTSSESANAQRARALEAAARDVAREPLGRGPGTAGPASFRNNGQARIAENYYLQIGQEVGPAGMAIFVAINVLVGVELWRRRTSDLAKILLASLVGLTFVNLVSHAWTDDTISYIWWGLAGIACAPTLTSAPQRPAQRRSR